MIRRGIAALSATGAFVALLGALMVPTAAPAFAAVPKSCTIAVSPTLWVSAPQTPIRASLAPDCAANGVFRAVWDVSISHVPYGVINMFFFDNTQSNVLAFLKGDPFGTYYVRPPQQGSGNFPGLTDANGKVLTFTQNTASYVAKAGSTVGVKATRAGSYVTTSVWTTNYNWRLNAYRPWSADKVTLQYKTCPTCVWNYLKNVYTDPNGNATYRALAPKTRYYRAVSHAEAGIWGRTSLAVVR